MPLYNHLQTPPGTPLLTSTWNLPWYCWTGCPGCIGWTGYGREDPEELTGGAEAVTNGILKMNWCVCVS